MKLARKFTYFSVIVDDLDALALGGHHPGTDGDIELVFRARFDPDVVSLDCQKKLE